MRRLGWTLLLPTLALACGALAASCSGGDAQGDWPGGATGPGTSSGTSSGGGTPSGSGEGDAGSGPVNGGGSDAASPQADDSSVSVPPPSGDGGTKGDAATACTLGSSGAIGLIPGGTMSPGLACVSCHASTGAKKLNAGGTVYPTLHEGNLCLGTKGLQVVITDSKGTDHTLSVNAVGNFYDMGLIGFSTPYTAKVVGASGSVAMKTPQTNVDCNACHTAAGTQGAAGRITGP
jgi:hypothetical protein